MTALPSFLITMKVVMGLTLFCEWVSPTCSESYYHTHSCHEWYKFCTNILIADCKHPRWQTHGAARRFVQIHIGWDLVLSWVLPFKCLHYYKSLYLCDPALLSWEKDPSHRVEVAALFKQDLSSCMVCNQDRSERIKTAYCISAGCWCKQAANITYYGTRLQRERWKQRRNRRIVQKLSTE